MNWREREKQHSRKNDIEIVCFSNVVAKRVSRCLVMQIIEAINNKVDYLVKDDVSVILHSREILSMVIPYMWFNGVVVGDHYSIEFSVAYEPEINRFTISSWAVI